MQVPVDEDSQPLLTINTHKGLFRYLYMAYGIASGPGYFQKTIEDILKDIKGVAIVADDVVVTGDTDEEHLQNLDKVLTRLEGCGLKGRMNKCQFFKEEITYLGYKISNDSISIDEAKYEAIAEMKTPSNHKELQLLLGKINYYGRLFRNRSKILASLYDCNNSENFVWNEKCQKAFNQAKIELKRVIINYDPTLLLILTCDASPQGLGAFISQPYTDGDKPVAFASTRLTKAQENYPQIDREAAALALPSFTITFMQENLF